MRKVKCVVIRKPRDMVVEDRSMPRDPGKGSVLIDVKAVGICGSDVHAYKGTQPFQTYPRILGHELAGNVSFPAGNLKEGQAVTMEPLLRCGECYPCRVGRYNCCVDLKVVGVHADGGMCERISSPKELVHPLPPNISLDEGALTEPLAIACQAVGRSRLSNGETALIIGAGPIGLLSLQVAKARGATVFVSEPDTERLDLAGKLGADALMNPAKEKIEDELDELTRKEGPNVVIEAFGSARTIKQAIDVVSSAGRVVIVGLYGRRTEFEPIALVRKELDVMGSRNSSGKFPEAISLMKEGEVRVSELITHEFPLVTAPEVFEGIDKGRIKPVKALLKPPIH